MNYTDKYSKYIDFLASKDYKEYINGLRLFFNNSPNQLCPKCNKPTIEKAYDNGIIYMKCTNPKCDWKLSIETAEYKDLYKTLYDDKKSSKELLYQLLNTDDFSSTKEKYLAEKTEIKSIVDIFEMQQKELDKKITEKIELYSEISIMYYKRKQIFSQIEKSIDSKLKHALLDIYKNEYKTMTDSRYKSVSKQFNISISDLKNVLLWFDISVKYIEKQTKLSELNKNIEEYEEYIENINNNLMVKLPVIKTLSSKESVSKEQKSESVSKEQKNEEQKSESVEGIEEGVSGKDVSGEGVSEEGVEDTSGEGESGEGVEEEEKGEEENDKKVVIDDEFGLKMPIVMKKRDNQILSNDEESVDDSKNIKTITMDKNILRNIDENIDHLDQIEEEEEKENEFDMEEDEMDDTDEEMDDETEPVVIEKIVPSRSKEPPVSSSGEKRIKLKISKK